jgi:hypothetical protein
MILVDDEGFYGRADGLFELGGGQVVGSSSDPVPADVVVSERQGR